MGVGLRWAWREPPSWGSEQMGKLPTRVGYRPLLGLPRARREAQAHLKLWGARQAAAASALERASHHAWKRAGERVACGQGRAAGSGKE